MRYTEDNSGTKETRESHNNSDTRDTSGTCQRMIPEAAVSARKSGTQEPRSTHHTCGNISTNGK